MIARLVFAACCAVAVLLAGLPGLVIYLCVSAAVFLLAAAVHRGWYR